jgi:hypothetical protein
MRAANAGREAGEHVIWPETVGCWALDKDERVVTGGMSDRTATTVVAEDEASLLLRAGGPRGIKKSRAGSIVPTRLPT